MESAAGGERMDPEDLDLLRRIQGGEHIIRQRPGQSYEDLEREVLRLIQLRDDGFITMRPEPKRTSRTRRGEYIQTGVCELTHRGHQAFERFER
jgi:hypothetical protein